MRGLRHSPHFGKNGAAGVKITVKHLQRSRTTWNFKKGDRVRFFCTYYPEWHKPETFTTSINKVTCPVCALRGLKKRLSEFAIVAERNGLKLETSVKSL